MKKKVAPAPRPYFNVSAKMLVHITVPIILAIASTAAAIANSAPIHKNTHCKIPIMISEHCI